MSTLFDQKSPMIRENEMRRLEECMKEPEFRGLLLEYARDISEKRPLYEKEMAEYELERKGDVIQFLHPTPGFVLEGEPSSIHVGGEESALLGEKRVFINICGESKVEAPSEGENRRWKIPYALSPGRKDLPEGTLIFDVMFHPTSLKKSSKNRRFKALLKETALDGVRRANPSLKVELSAFQVSPNTSYKGVPHPTVIRSKRAPDYVIKYRDNLADKVFSQSVPSVAENPARPSEIIVEIHLPEFSGAAGVDLDVTRSRLTLKTQKPIEYNLDVKFSYPVNEELGTAKFEKCSKKLIVTVPVLPPKESAKRLISIDSGIESDCLDTLPSSPLTSDCNEESDNDSSTSVMPDFKLNMTEEILTFTFPVKNVDPSSFVNTPYTAEHLRGYRISFSSMGSGMVRFDYHFVFALYFADGLPDSLDEPSLDCWDNNVTLDVYASPAFDDILVGKTVKNLRVQTDPSLSALRNQQSKFLHLKKEHCANQVEKKESEFFEEHPCVVESKPSKERHSSDESDSSKERHTSDESEESLEKAPSIECNRFTVTSLEKQVDDAFSSVELQPLPLIDIQPSLSTIRGILKRRERCFSESQADQLRRWEEAAASVSQPFQLLEEDSFYKNGDDMNRKASCNGKKSVRFNDQVQRQIFRQNASILGQKNKNSKKSEQKRRKNALRERRASEGDAQKDQHFGSLSDSGVEASSNAEEDESDNQSTTNAKSKTKRNKRLNKNKLSKSNNVFHNSSNVLMFELDLE